MVLKLSIIVVSYNHEKYIAEAMDSIFLQKLDCEYEIIIADDYSTDKTLHIIEGYRNKYPDKITILPSLDNLGVTKNYQRAFSACKGEYIAILEGDDYWTSPHKISRQINYLEEHLEASFCFHRFIAHDQDSKRFFVSRDMNSKYKKLGILTTEDLIKDNFIGNFSTCMYRNRIVENLPNSLYEITVYDWMFNIVNSQYGVIGYIDEPMSIYRQHSKGSWSSQKDRVKILHILGYIETYNKFLDYRFDNEFKSLSNSYKIKIFWKSRLKSLFSIKGIYLCTPKIFKLAYKLLCPPVVTIIIRKLMNKG